MEPERIAEALRDVLQPGDRFIVRHEDGEIRIAPLEPGAAGSPLRDQHPELYGHLVTVNQRLESTSACATLLFLFAVAVGGCIAVRELLPDYASAWVYAGVFVLVAGVWILLDDHLEKRAYEEERSDLHAAISRAGYNRDRLVTALLDDEHVEKTIEHLKRDPSAR